MLLNRKQLEVCSIIGKDKKQPLLNNVHITENNDVIAANNRSVIAVSSIDGNKSPAVTINASTIDKVVKAIPKASKFGDLIQTVECNDKGNSVEFILSDGVRENSLSGAKYPFKYADYKAWFKSAFDNIPDARFVINLKRFIDVLKTIERITKDNGDEVPVFFELRGNNLVVKCQAFSTDYTQRVLAVVNLDKTSKWLGAGKMEERLLDMKFNYENKASVHLKENTKLLKPNKAKKILKPLKKKNSFK